MPISPIEISLSQQERDFRRLCEAIDKHILDKFQIGGALRFNIKEDTPQIVINRAEREYTEQGWRVLYAEEIHDKCVCSKKYPTCPEHTVQPPNTKIFVFSQESEEKAKARNSASADDLLDAATNKLTKTQWSLRRETLFPPLYEAIICGELVGSANSEDGNLTIQIRNTGKTAEAAAKLATEKLATLLKFVPEIKIPA